MISEIESSIRLIVKKLAESIMQPLALARILGVIKSAGCSLSYNTLVDYLQYLNDAYLNFWYFKISQTS